MALRIIPALTVAVTEESVRKRKRLLMLFPGLIAFVLYRALQVAGWHSDTIMLLLSGGLFSWCVAVFSYIYGRDRRLSEVLREDGTVHLIWLGFRYGFLYAVQLSLMVLALLQAFSYGYHEHPDGPAMMALIIASTSVSRDAFELGHLRLLQQQGRLFLTFPSRRGRWRLILGRIEDWVPFVLAAALVTGVIYLSLAVVAPVLKTNLGQLLMAGLLPAASGTLAYLRGLRPERAVWQSVTQYPWRELIRFFVWPGMAFGWTYALIVQGITGFLFKMPDPPLLWKVGVMASIAAMMTLYCLYLGRCRWQEEKLHATISPSMLRCPFILGVLTSKKV
jgi:hypothetical protein